VHNAQSILAERVCRLLELLPDIAPRFEIVVIDDGSTDHTYEIAAELADQFPQLKVLRQGRRQGVAAALELGMQQSRGDFVLVQDPAEAVSPSDLRRLWEMRLEEGLVAVRTEPKVKPIDAGLMERLIRWGRSVEQTADASAGMQLFRRQAVRELAENPAAQRNLQVSQSPGGQKIAKTIPRRKSGNVMTQLRQFALGE
jgi:glycosyltransferase involved in cell wall biosynthesis